MIGLKGLSKDTFFSLEGLGLGFPFYSLSSSEELMAMRYNCCNFMLSMCGLRNKFLSFNKTNKINNEINIVLQR